MTDATIHGDVQPGFEAVADAFLTNFRVRGDTGAACAVYADGRLVVDLWAGDTGRGPWTHDTRSVLFSVSKGVTTVLLLMAAERGQLDLDRPVAEYWPEFAAHGKDTITVRSLLAHRAGLICPTEPLTAADLAEWEPVTAALARQQPLWSPDTAWAYHPVTMGWLAGEVLRRVTGQRPSAFLRDHVAGPLKVDMTYGTAADAADLAPIGSPLPDTDPALAAQILAALATPYFAPSMGMNGAFDGLDIFNTANSGAFLDIEMPAANLVTRARDLARFYAATVSDVDGTRLLTPDTIAQATTPVSTGRPFTGYDAGLRFGTGFMLDSPARRMLGPGSFGHDGAGGQLGFGHIGSGTALGYQTVRPGGAPDERAEALSAALHACL